MKSTMKSTLFAAALVLGPIAALAADDPIAARQSLMDSMGGAAGLAAGVLKGEIEYSPALGKAAITTANAVAHVLGDYFPEGSETGHNTSASPKIWEDPEGFAAEIAELQEAAYSAMEAAGKEGPADVDAFKAAFQPVLGMCKDCHETYRVDN
jgi:cytochrome c556